MGVLPAAKLHFPPTSYFSLVFCYLWIPLFPSYWKLLTSATGAKSLFRSLSQFSSFDSSRRDPTENHLTIGHDDQQENESHRLSVHVRTTRGTRDWFGGDVVSGASAQEIRVADRIGGTLNTAVPFAISQSFSSPIFPSQPIEMSRQV